MKAVAYIALGANLGDPKRQVLQAMQDINQIKDSKLLKASSLYQSVSMGDKSQADYINAVVKIETHLAADLLLSELFKIENQHGRVRGADRWGPRTLDLDLSLYADTVLNTDFLKLPHPGVYQRNFVILPLYQIAPELTLPTGQAIAELAKHVSKVGINRIESD